MSSCRRGLAPSSIGRHLASLSTFFRFLVFEGKLTENVAKLLVAPAVWDRLPTVLGPAAVDRLLELARPRRRGWAVATGPRSRPSTRPAAEPRRSSGSGPPTSTSRRGLARCVGKGNKERWVPLGSRAIDGPVRLSREGSPRPDRPSSRDGHRPGRAVGSAALPDRPLADRQAACAAGRTCEPRSALTRSAQLRHPPAGRRGRPAGRPGDARATRRSPRPRSTPASS